MIKTTTHVFGLSSYYLLTWQEAVGNADSRELRRRSILSTNCIDPSGPLWFTFRNSKKKLCPMNLWAHLYNLYAAAQRHSLHEPFSLAVNLVRNIKSCLVFANHRNKQPHVTWAWRHGKHRYNTEWCELLSQWTSSLPKFSQRSSAWNSQLRF